MEETEEKTTPQVVESQPSGEEEPIEPVEAEPKAEPAEEEPAEETPVSPAGGPIESPIIASTSGSGDKKKYIIIVLIVVAVLALIAGAILVYRRGMSKREAALVSTTETETGLPLEETEAPEVSPEAELKREDLKLQVLNGSGITGAASEAKEFLEGLDYQNIETGNADSYDYEETEISIKEDKEDYLEMLRDDLKDEYTLSTESATLEEESDFDVVIIIGSK